VHRIGQQKAVKIYRLITAKTYEQHMFHRASLKLGLEVAVMDQMRLRKGEESLPADGKKKASADKLSPEDVRVIDSRAASLCLLLLVA
jgi:SNF2 family DNA or RNA helicase